MSALLFSDGSTSGITKAEGLPATLATGLNKDDDNVTVYDPGCNATEVDLATDADVVVSSVPCIVHWVFVNAVVSAHEINLVDDATTRIILPVSLAAGVQKNWQPGAKFNTSLKVNVDDSATGKIVIGWSAQ